MNVFIANVSNPLQTAQLAALALDALLKSFVVLGLAGGVCALWRRASAATRHLIWFLAVISLPGLALLSSTLPSWQRPLWTVSTGSDSGNQISLALELAPRTIAQESSATPGATEISAAANPSGSGRKVAARFGAIWLRGGLAVWLAGAGLVLLSVAAGQFRLRQFSRNAQPLHDADWARLLAEARETLRLRRAVTLLRSADNVMPLTWGWRRPVVLLPAEAARWPAERRRIVLLHELAHAKRRDCLTQLAAKVVCALYWFNPLVWLAARQMRVERELACDDLVLAAGCKASDYAGHLVEIAGNFRHVPLAAAIAIARSSRLEGRIAAIVDASRNRRLRSAAAIAILALIGGLAVSLGGSGTSAVGGADKSSRLRQQQIERLRTFSAEKEKQSQTLAAAAGEKISPEYQEFFDAATSGNWRAVTNSFESFKQRHGQYSHAHGRSDPSLRTSFWSPVLEICLAYDHVVRCEPEYTQMAVDGIVNSIPAGGIYFGGTDPGRGLPTAFCKSHVEADPFFTLTQNALADATYLDYLQRTYGAQRELLPQVAAACQSDVELKAVNDLWPSAVKKLQKLDINGDDPQWNQAEELLRQLWAKRDERVKEILADVQARAGAQKAAGTNQAGTKTIYIPTGEDSQRSFVDYLADAQKRLQNHQLKPGEEVKNLDGRIQVSGQVAVMQINGLLAKVIVDKNPDREVFIEESFPLDWMYPYLEPHGLILRLNRHPLSELSDAAVRQDREYWQPRVTQMIGGWLDDGTPVKDIVAFAERVFLRHDLAGFAGDPRFVENEYAPRMFAKFRSAIAGLYAWRADHADTASQKERMTRAADVTFRQALALCPDSPEAVERYANFLKSRDRAAEARLVTDLAAKLKSKSTSLSSPRAKKPVLQMRLVLDAAAENTESMTNVVHTGSSTSFVVLNVAKDVLLDDTDLESASLIKDQQGYPRIELTFTTAGHKKFAEVTRAHIRQRLAIIVDGKLLSSPMIATEISGGKAEVSGSFGEEEAQALTAKINEAAGR